MEQLIEIITALFLLFLVWLEALIDWIMGLVGAM